LFYGIVICINSVLEDDPSRILKIIRRFGNHCSCHLQGEYVMVGRYLNPCIGHAVSAELDWMVLIGGAEKRAANQLEINTWLRKRGDESFIRKTVSRGGDERRFGDHTNRKSSVANRTAAAFPLHQSEPPNPTRHLRTTIMCSP
jgi:hypothetical protein